MSEEQVHIKDLCESVRAVYVLEKLPDVSGPGLIEPTLMVSQVRVS